MKIQNLVPITILTLFIGGCSSPETELGARPKDFMGEEIDVDVSEVEQRYQDFLSEPRDLTSYKIAENFIDTQTSGNVEIELLRMMCQPIEVHAAESGLPISWYIVVFPSTRTTCLMTLRITNRSDEIREVYPDDGIPGGVDPSEGEAWFETSEGDLREAISFAGASNFDFYSGVVKPNSQLITAFWIRTDLEWEEITGISYTAGAPLDENQVPVGEGYDFKIDMSGWDYVPLPEELEPFFAEWNVQP